jgi:hypothetical protein
MSGAGWRQFAANEVLTSTNVQNYLQDQAVMRFASATARNSAITAPTQGMTAYLDDTGLTTQYFSAGTGGRASAGWYPLGVQLVKSIAIGSAVSSVTVSGAFTSDFNHYRIAIAGGIGSGNQNLNLKLGSTTTGYYYGSIISAYGPGTVAGTGGANAASFANFGYTTTGLISFDAYVSNPYNAGNTTVSALITSPYTAGGAGVVGGVLADSNSYTDFTITPNSGTLTGGTIYVYGWSK